MKFLLLFLPIVLLVSCYKVPDGSPGTQPPEFGIYLDDNLILDSTNYLKANDSFSYKYAINFVATSGNPAFYPISCHFSGLPAGITITPDSFNFKLNNTISFNLASGTTVVGEYTIFLNVNSATYGQQSYPIKLKVYPY